MQAGLTGAAAAAAVTQGGRAHVKVEQVQQLGQVYEGLRDMQGAGKRKRRHPADLAVLGDAWLGPAVADGLLQPIVGAERSRWWGLLPPELRRLVRRDAAGGGSSHGWVWGVPYRWGCAAIVYRKDKLRRGVDGWRDLFRAELAGKVGFVGSTRMLLACALQSLGLSVNPDDLHRHPEVQQRLEALVRNVRVFGESDALKALEVGDVWATVAWTSPQVHNLVARNNKVGVAVPGEGTVLFCDVMVTPARSAESPPRSPLTELWLDFVTQPARAEPHLGLSQGAASFHTLEGGPPAGKGKLMPGPETLGRSEFLYPLPDAALAQLRGMVLQ